MDLFFQLFIKQFFCVQLTYSPNTLDTTSIDYFNVVAIGNVSKSVIKCSGSSKGLYLTCIIQNFREGVCFIMFTV